MWVCVLPKWMSIVWFLHRLDDCLINSGQRTEDVSARVSDWSLKLLLSKCSSSGSMTSPEGDGDTEAGEQQVWHHADNRQRCHGNEDQQGSGKRCSRLLWLSPVNQLEDCEGTKRRSMNDSAAEDLKTSRDSSSMLTGPRWTDGPILARLGSSAGPDVSGALSFLSG